MSLIRNLSSGMRSLFRKEQVNRDLDEQIRAYLDLAVEDKMKHGMTREDATRNVRLEQGNLESSKEIVRSGSWESALETLWQDVRFTARILHKNPGFAGIAILILALGIGANTAVFSMVDALILRPLPVPKPEQIVVLAFTAGNGGLSNHFSVSEYRDIANETSDVFSGVIGYWFGIDGLSINGRAERIFTNYVTGNYFSTLGIKPVLGRFIVPTEGEVPGSDPVVVLSYDCWRARFNSDSSVVGTKVLIDGKPITVIGVAPKDFFGISPLLKTDAYLPLGMLTLEGEPSDFTQTRTLRSLGIAARLSATRTVAQARTALAIVAHRMAQGFPAADKDIQLMVFPELRARPDPDPSNTMLLMSGLFQGLVIVVLLLACMNLANLSLARATMREAEITVRSALGAGRSRLIRQLLTESILLAMLGALAGLVFGRSTSLLISNPDLHSDLPIRLDFDFDWRVFIYAFVVALVTGLLVGIAPALRVSRTDVNLLLRQAGRGVLGGRNRLRSCFVVAQIAGSLMLLIIAGLFIRSARVAQRADLGFDPRGVVDVSMDPGEIGYSQAQGLAFYQTLLDRARALPGVDQAALTSSIPLSYYNDADSLNIDSYHPTASQRPAHAMFSVVSPGYLQTIRVPLLRGRTFNQADDATSPYVAIINEEMARRYWPNQDPLGRHFAMGRDPSHPIEVVGVARNSRVAGVTGKMVANFYVPLQQHYSSGLTSLQTLVVHTNGDSAAILRELQSLIQGLAPDLPLFDAQPMPRAIDSLNGLLIYKIGAVLVGTLGVLGLVLSIVGVYGVLSYSVSQRRQEFGVRIALGAQPRSIVAMVLRKGALLVGIGLVIGIGASLAASKVVNSFLTISPVDPLTYVTVTLILTLVALVSCYLPARRTTRIDPIVALRYE